MSELGRHSCKSEASAAEASEQGGTSGVSSVVDADRKLSHFLM